MANKIPLAYADVELQLSTAISVGSTSFSLSSANDDDGNALPAGKYCFTVDNGLSTKEYLIGQLNGTNVTSVYSVSRQGVETSGAARAHRVGASVILTDFATIQRVADILRGQETLDGANPIIYDAEPTLADRKELATVGYVLDTVTGGTVAFDAQTITGNAGESVVAGNLVYFKTSDQEWYKTDADTAATVDGVQLGIALGTGSDGGSIAGGVQISGTYTTSGLTAGAAYYASNTAGAISSSAGTNSRIVGLALSTTKLLLIPTTPQSPTTGQIQALAGTPSTPSSTNKFVTQGKSVTAGETISGATTPVPVYQSKADNEFYACDANDTNRLKFLGFAISNGTDGGSMIVQFSGVVGGFTGLSEGEKYYVQDSVGTIGTTIGTYEVLVGIAISETELLIQRGKLRAAGSTTFDASASGSAAITCGFRPSRISLKVMTVASANAATSEVHIEWINGTTTSLALSTDSSGDNAINTTARLYSVSSIGNYQTIAITSVTDTGFTIQWTETGTVSNGDGSAYIWEAEGEL